MQTLPLVHPKTHAPLIREGSGWKDPATGDFFADQHGVPSFVPASLAEHMDGERSGLINTVKTVLRYSPTLYVFLIWLISPVCYTGLSAQKFLKKFKKGSLMLNVGAGVHRPHPDIVNTDIFYYEGIDLVANAEELPLASNSVDAIVCESLLEHVPNPKKIVTDMYRVLKPGGQMYIVIPFVYPFHACPNDFYRWSITGLKELLKDGEIEKIGTRAGPSSALTGQLGTWFAIVFSFGYEPLYNIMSLVGLVLFCPLKFLDWIFGRFPTAIHGAGQFYAVARKKA